METLSGSQKIDAGYFTLCSFLKMEMYGGGVEKRRNVKNKWINLDYTGYEIPLKKMEEIGNYSFLKI